ncbi:MAG TPA: hypothetical protein VF126_01470 [Acidobacteriaceae bacterium]
MRDQPHSSSQQSTLGGLCCGLLAGLAVLLTLPFAAMGFIDDWSYVRTAYDFSRTGHFIYNGWATAMLGWQIVWTAPFLKAFGYSFTVARLSMLPFAIGCGWLLHALLRHSNISNRNAIFGSLTFCLSPLFIPLAASYMSDVGGLFVILLCFYLCQRAVEAQSATASILWLCAATVTNVVGGTERQIVWLGALVVVPSAAWLLRTRRGVVATAVTLWLASIILIFVSTHWFYRQRYSVPEKVLYPPVQQGSVSTAALILERLHTAYIFSKSIFLAVVLFKTFLCLLLILLPILIAWIVVARRLGHHVQVKLGVLALLLGVACWILKMQGNLDNWLMPWLYHVLDSEGIAPTSWDMIGYRPISLSYSVRTALSIIVVLSGAALLLWSVAPREKTVLAPRADWTASWRTLFILYLPYTAAYLVLLLPRGLRFYIFDRYLLGIMPVFILFLLKMYEERVGKSLPAVCYVALCLFAFYGIAATHDLFALNRARVAAVQQVRSRGVPEQFVQAGFEYDGWTEVDQAGYVNESKIGYPADAFHLNVQDARRPVNCRLGFDQYTPALHPRYIVVFTPVWCLEPSGFPPVSYRAWLPPFVRRIYIERVPRPLQDP